MCQSLFFNKVAGMRPSNLLKKSFWYRCFPVNFVKFLRTPFLKITSGRLLLNRVSSLKFLGVIFDEKFNRKEHLNTIDEKVSKNTGILYETKDIINTKGLRNLYHSFIHTSLKVQSCKLYNTKYRFIHGASSQITNTEIFTFKAVLVFKLLSHKVLFINRKDKRNCEKVGYFSRK